MPLRMAMCLVVLLLGVGSLLQAADAISAEELVPEETIAALIIPDLASARASAVKTRLGEMYSQPEMQQFIQPIQAELEKQYAGIRAKNPLVPAGADIDNALLSGEVAIAVCAFSNNPRKEASVVVTFRPKDAKAFERLLPEQLRPVVLAGQPLPLPNRKMRAQWVKDRLVLVSDAADFPEVLARLEKKAEKSLATVLAYSAAKAKFSNPAGWVYFSPVRLSNLLTHLMEAKEPRNLDKMKGLLSSLGVDKVSAVVAGLGFSNGIPVLESSVILDGPPTGIAALFVPPANTIVKPDGFKFAALDAPFIATGYFNAAGILPLVRRTLEVEPRALAEFDQGLLEVQNVMGFDLQKDFVENIGSECIAVQTSVDTGLPLSFLPGVTYVFAAKNPAKLEEVLSKLAPAFEKVPELIKMQYRVKKLAYKEKNLHYLASILTPFPMVFCVHGDYLLVGTTVNAVKRTIDQLENKDNILSNKSFQESITRVSGKPFDPNNLPAGLAYSRDEGNGLGALVLCGLYYTVAGGTTVGLAELPNPAATDEEEFQAGFEEGFNGLPPPFHRASMKTLYALGMAVDLGLWPDESFFRKYRMPSAGFTVVDANGLFSRTELPVPAPNTGSSGTIMIVTTAAVAVIAAVAVPSLLRSRMAANQTAAAAGCKAYAEAQEIYRRTDYDEDGVLEYAQSLGGDNSLLELKKGAGDLALVDRTFAMAEGNPSQSPVPKAGYCFKVLKAQGANATGGKRSYVVNGNMVLGYALVAYPAAYDGTGRDTFVISNNGTIFQKDMGEETHAIVEAMTEFDPDDTWAPAE